jgi:hypothetical protein
MALLPDSNNTYLEFIDGDLEEFYNVLLNSFQDQKWIILKDDFVNKILVVRNPNNDFCLGFSGFRDFLNNVYVYNITCFMDYDENLSLNDQRLSNPKENFKGLTKDWYEPQIAFGNFTTEYRLYLQITDKYISGTIINLDNNDCRAFFGGFFNAYASIEQYNLPLFIGGCTQADDSIIIAGEERQYEPFSSVANTTSNYMFGRRLSNSTSDKKSGDYLLNPFGKWERLEHDRVDTYPDKLNSIVEFKSDNASVFPISYYNNYWYGSLTGQYKTEKVRLLQQQDDFKNGRFLGEIPNILLMYQDDNNFKPVESVISINNDQYIVFRDIFRSLYLTSYYLMKII